ncbi:GGDEF domain-containing protein [Rhizobium sp.]|uniref:GGDEF domain-containing protein n=1 Tax=Rhizobium sp. TaxID=391 RepID=UPI0039181C74
MPYIVSQKRQRSDTNSSSVQGAIEALDGAYLPIVAAGRTMLSIRDFYQLGGPIVSDCIEGERACSIAIIDIDRLFRISEQHGPDCADHVLQEFGANLIQLSSDLDISVAHLGQDQFGLLLVGLTSDTATEAFDRLRYDLSLRPIGWKGEMINITVSVGVAEVYGPETFDNYLNAAEQFLFMAKMSGRNQVVSDHTFAIAAH